MAVCAVGVESEGRRWTSCEALTFVGVETARAGQAIVGGAAGLAGPLTSGTALAVQIEACGAVVSTFSVCADHIGAGVKALAVDEELTSRARDTVGGRSETVEAVGAARLAVCPVVEVGVRAFHAALFVEKNGSTDAGCAFGGSIHASLARGLASNTNAAQSVSAIGASRSAGARIQEVSWDARFASDRSCARFAVI